MVPTVTLVGICPPNTTRVRHLPYLPISCGGFTGQYKHMHAIYCHNYMGCLGFESNYRLVQLVHNGLCKQKNISGLGLGL